MSLFSSIKSMIKGSGGSVLGIDIGSSMIKIVSAHSEKGAVVLDTCLAVNVSMSEIGKSVAVEPKVIAATILGILKEYNLMGIPVSFSTSRDSTFVKLITITSIPDEKLSQVMRYEMRKYIPHPIEEVKTSFIPIPSNLLESESKSIFEEDDPMPMSKKEQVRHLLLIAIYISETRKLREITEHARITADPPYILNAGAMCVIEACETSTHLPYAIVDIGTKRSSIYIVNRGIPIHSTTANVGGQHITESISRALGISFIEAEDKKRTLGLAIPDEGAREAIVLQIDEIFSRLSDYILRFEHEYRQSVSKVILSGGGASMRGILEEAQKKVNVDLEIARPFGRFRTQGAITDDSLYKDKDPEVQGLHRKEDVFAPSDMRPGDAIFTSAAGAALMWFRNNQ